MTSVHTESVDAVRVIRVTNLLVDALDTDASITSHESVLALLAVAVGLIRGGVHTREEAYDALDRAAGLYEQVSLEELPADDLPRA